MYPGQQCEAGLSWLPTHLDATPVLRQQYRFCQLRCRYTEQLEALWWCRLYGLSRALPKYAPRLLRLVYP